MAVQGGKLPAAVRHTPRTLTCPSPASTFSHLARPMDSARQTVAARLCPVPPLLLAAAGGDAPSREMSPASQSTASGASSTMYDVTLLFPVSVWFFCASTTIFSFFVRMASFRFRNSVAVSFSVLFLAASQPANSKASSRQAAPHRPIAVAATNPWNLKTLTSVAEFVLNFGSRPCIPARPKWPMSWAQHVPSRGASRARGAVSSRGCISMADHAMLKSRGSVFVLQCH